jgi:hypothetical protein
MLSVLQLSRQLDRFEGAGIREQRDYMRYRVKAPIIGRLFLTRGQTSLTSVRDGLILELLANEKGRVTHIQLTKPIPPDIAHKYSSTADKDPDGITHIKIHGDKPFALSLLKELRLIESTLSFMYPEHPVDRIRVDRISEEWLADSEVEKQRLKVHAFSSRKSGPPPVVVIPGQIDRCFQFAPRYESLMVPLAFYREGMTSFQEERFIPAFYNFYFVIEDFFADGKTATKEILKAFSSSSLLTTLLQRSLQSFAQHRDHGPALKKLFHDVKCDFTIEGAREFLIATRGNLHHYFSKSPRTTGTPFNDAVFEPVALLAMELALGAIFDRTTELDKVAGSPGPLSDTPDTVPFTVTEVPFRPEMADRLPGATHVYHVALKPDYEIEQPSVTVSCDKMILKPVLSLGGPISGNCIQAQKGRQFTLRGSTGSAV